MNLSRPVRLSLLLASTLGILAACDVSDSPARADAPSTTTFAPRILAPAGGVRQADWLHLQIWKQNGQTGQWDSLHSEADLPPTRATLQVKVPLRQKLRYRVAGYAVTFPNGTRQVDTVWSAEETDFILYDTLPVQRNSGTVARNWAVSPSVTYADTVEFRPGNELVIPAPAGQRLAWSRTSATVSCATALPVDSALKVTPLVQTSLQLWVRTCSEDPTVLPSSVRSYQWKVDTLGIGAQNTPLAPIASGVSGFADLGRILSIENDPTKPLSFSMPVTSVLAWSLKVSPDTIPPEVADFPAAPGTADSADESSTGTSLELWTDSLKNAVARSASGLRVAVSLVRIDTNLGKAWVSPPTRFWFRLSPPAAPSRFELTGTRWDSVRVDWSLGRSGLTYRAWRAPGSTAVDPARATELTANFDSSSWFLGGLPPDSALSILLEIRDPGTGLVRREQRSARTKPLPSLPTPILVTPNTFGAQIKVGALGTVKVESPADSAGRSTSFLWTFSKAAKSVTPDPSSLPWPEVPATGALSSTDGSLAPSASPGEYVFLTVVTADAQGRRSAPMKQLLEVVADDVDVPPNAPTGLRVKNRTESSITFAWTNTPGTVAWLRYDINRTGETIVSTTTTDTTHTITGLKAGDSLLDVGVKALQIAPPRLQSAFSQPSLNTRTRLPPVAPGRALAQWIEDAAGLRLRIRWEHFADQDDQIAWEGITSQGQQPGSPQWRLPSSGKSGPDSLEIPYVDLPKTPWLAIGLRALRDSIAGAAVWTPVRIPALAPDIALLRPRIWQKGESLWVSLDRTGMDTAFVLNAKASQGTLVKSFEVTGSQGGASLAGFAAGKLSGELWWTRRTSLGVRAFDTGTVLRVEKNLLPAPTGFALVPGDSITDWILQPSTGLVSGAKAVLVVRSGRDGKVAYVEAPAVESNPADKDTFQLVQVLDGDTSLATAPRTILVSTGSVTPSIPQGNYLFPFPITLTGSGGGVQVATTGSWGIYNGAFDPFAVGSFKTRLSAAFLANSARTLSYVQDSTFNNAIWGKRVDAATTSGATTTPFLKFGNAKISYTAQDVTARVPAIINVQQDQATASAYVWFPVDPVGGGTMDLSRDSAISLRLYKPVGYLDSIFLTVLTTTEGEIDITLPTNLQGDHRFASFTGSSSSLPYYNSTLGKRVTIPWEKLPTYLARVQAIGLQTRGDLLTSRSSIRITSLAVIPKGKP